MLGNCSNVSKEVSVQHDIRPQVTSCPSYKQKNLATNKELVSEYGRLYFLWVECYKKHEIVKEYYEKIDDKK